MNVNNQLTPHSISTRSQSKVCQKVKILVKIKTQFTVNFVCDTYFGPRKHHVYNVKNKRTSDNRMNILDGSKNVLMKNVVTCLGAVVEVLWNFWHVIIRR